MYVIYVEKKQTSKLHFQLHEEKKLVCRGMLTDASRAIEEGTHTLKFHD